MNVECPISSRTYGITSLFDIQHLIFDIKCVKLVTLLSRGESHVAAAFFKVPNAHGLPLICKQHRHIEIPPAINILHKLFQKAKQNTYFLRYIIKSQKSMKKAILAGSLILIAALATAQTVAVSGTVSDTKNNTVPFAFIYDSQHSYATYADSAGAFSFSADPTSKLIATAVGYAKTTAKMDNPADVKIVMTSDGSGSGQGIAASLKNIFNQEQGVVDMTANSQVLIGTHQEELHGSRFLFKHWVHGFVLSPQDSIKQNDNYLFNYDKIDGNFIFATGGTAMHLGVKSDVKQFILFDNNGDRYVFENLPAIDGKHYLQVLASGKKYKIYKNFNTKFLKSDYTTNGITSHGNNYDSFVDEATYYLVKLPAGVPQELSLRKKAIKNAFAADADKVNKFFADNDGDIDDAYLAKLGEYMNQ